MHSNLSAITRSDYFNRVIPAFAVVIGLLGVTAFAADVTSTWSTATSGNWNVNANWMNAPALGGFPNNGNGGVSTYDAVINAVGAPYTVTLNTNVTVEDLQLNSANATLNHTTGTFTATGAINLTAGTYQLNGGTISNSMINSQAGAFAVAANNANLLSGVTINGDLTLNVVNGRTKLAGGTTFNTAHLSESSVGLAFAPGQTLSNTIVFEGPSVSDRAVEMDGTAGTFTVGPAGVLRTAAGLGSDARIGGTWWYGGAMTLENQGLISSQTNGRTVTINAPTLTNSATGILEAANGGILTINSTNWSSAGNLRVLAGSRANLTGTWSNLGGTITTDATSTLNLGGNFSTANLGTLSMAAGSRVNILGNWNNSGQSFTFNSATSSWTLNGGSITGGSIGFADGQTLLIGDSNANLLSGLTVNGDLTLDVANGRAKLAGTTFNTAHLAATNAGLGFAPGQTLTTTILFEGAAVGDRAVELDGTAGTFTVGPTGVMRTTAGLGSNARIGVGAWWFGGAMTLVNDGLISSQTNGRTVTIGAGTLTNSATGILEATGGGILTIDSTNWSNAGNLRALGGSTANLNGTWSNLGGTITADATSRLNLGGSFSTANVGTLSLATGSRVIVLGTWNNSGQNFTFSNSTGSWTLNGGSINGGSIGSADGQTLLIAPSNANLLSGVTINGDLTLNVNDGRTKLAGTTFNTAHLAATNAGLGFAPGQTLTSTILFEGAAAGDRAVEMNGTAGMFTIGPTGAIRTAAGLGSNARIGVGTWWFGGAMTLVNEGLISSQTSGRTVTVGANSVSNSGTLEAINGGSLAVTAGYTQTAGVTRLSGGGTLSASSNTSVLNSITINGGRLEGSGTIMANVANSATIAVSPGPSSGTMAITGDLSLASTSTLQLELGGANQGVDFDFLSEGGTTPLNLAGALNITLLNGFVPDPADPLVIVSSNQPITGIFSNVVAGRILASDGVTSLPLSVIGNHVVIGGLTGDYNHDGVVDAADYVVWRKTLGQSGTNLAADGNHNNQVDADDHATWRSQFGATVSGSGGALSSIPEPATWLLLGSVVLAATASSLPRRQPPGYAP